MHKIEAELITFLTTIKKKTMTRKEWISEIGFYWNLTSETTARYKFNLLIHKKYLVATANGYTKKRD